MALAACAHAFVAPLPGQSQHSVLAQRRVVQPVAQFGYEPALPHSPSLTWLCLVLNHNCHLRSQVNDENVFSLGPCPLSLSLPPPCSLVLLCRRRSSASDKAALAKKQASAKANTAKKAAAAKKLAADKDAKAKAAAAKKAATAKLQAKKAAEKAALAKKQAALKAQQDKKKQKEISKKVSTKKRESGGANKGIFGALARDLFGGLD